MYMPLRTAIFTLALICSAQVAGWAMQIEVTSKPRLGTTNRLLNPDFEEGAQAPLAWRFGTARSDILRGAWSDEAFTGEKSLFVEAASGEMSGYWGQNEIAVRPGESLLFSAWVKLPRGRVLMYVIGYDGSKAPPQQVYDDRRLYLSAAGDHPLFPVFVKAELLKGMVGPDWQRQRLFFQNADNATLASVRLGLYFFGMRPGTVWFDGAYFGVPWVELTVKVSGADGAGGIQRVQVLDDTGWAVYDSGSFAEPVESWTHAIRVPADAAFYTVVVTDGTGRLVEQRHP